MTNNRINVLVYSGTGSTPESVRHCIFSLRRLLSPNYAVLPVTESTILKEPWTSTCALLVLPGGADLGYCRSLNGEGNRGIIQYVRRGGAYFGFCAGGYYGCSRCEFEVGNKDLEVVGNRELGFFPGTCRGLAFPGFVYHSEAGARAAELKVNESALIPAAELVPNNFRAYYNGGGVFVDAEKFRNRGVEVLASYTENLDVDPGQGAAALVYCKVGDGAAILTGPHPEFAAANLDKQADTPDYPELVHRLKQDEKPRTDFLKACLLKLGLRVIQADQGLPSLTSLHLSSHDSAAIASLLKSWQEITTMENGEDYVKGEHDTFCIEKRTTWSMKSLARATRTLLSGKSSEQDNDLGQEGDRILDYDKIIKPVLVHENQLPTTTETPFFNHEAFFSSLEKYNSERRGWSKEFGKILLYGEVVTSTSTMLDKNPTLLKRLPTGFTATATLQVAGRGRGSNVWISPAGSLMFSSVLRHPLSLTQKAPVVFVQYLAALAIVEGFKTYDHGYGDIPVRLKWPNDIYALDTRMKGSQIDTKKSNSKGLDAQAGAKDFVKIGGILVNSSYAGSDYTLVVGVGLNVANGAPTTSLNALLPSNLQPFTPEKLLARMLTCFERLYERFCRSGFDREMEDTYYEHWLHSNQIVTLEAEGGVRARIKGITRDWGLLVAEELGSDDRGTGKMWQLQSDSNSFDFFKGLLKRKL